MFLFVEKILPVITEENIIATPDSILGQGYEIYHSSNIDIMITRDPIQVYSYDHPMRATSSSYQFHLLLN